MPKFECDRCGACCEGHLIVEADDLDVLREARLVDADRYHAGAPVESVVYAIRNEFKAVIVAGPQPCPFLGDDKSCIIYPTRPNCCVGMEAGDEQCQESRAAAGLPPLPRLELCKLNAGAGHVATYRGVKHIRQRSANNGIGRSIVAIPACRPR